MQSVTRTTRAFRRLMIFIDGTNFLAGCVNFQRNNNSEWKISYELLERCLRANAAKDSLIRLEHIKTFYYGPQCVPEQVKQIDKNKTYNALLESFLKDLRQNHVRVILKPKINGKEKNIDAALVTDFLSLAYSNAYDYVVLVSGDADFISAIDEVKRQGKIICLASFKSDFNEALLEHIDKIIFLDDYAQSFFE